MGSCLIYVIYVCLGIVVSNTYCVCHRPVYLVLPVSLHGPFAIASSVFSNVYSLNTLFILFSISKKIILGVIFPPNQSVTFLPNAEVLKSNEEKNVVDALSICLLTCCFQTKIK